MEKQKIQIQIEKSRYVTWGCCKVNGNLITSVAKTENIMKERMKLAIFQFEGIETHLIEFEEEYI